MIRARFIAFALIAAAFASAGQKAARAETNEFVGTTWEAGDCETGYTFGADGRFKEYGTDGEFPGRWDYDKGKVSLHYDDGREFTTYKELTLDGSDLFTIHYPSDSGESIECVFTRLNR